MKVITFTATKAGTPETPISKITSYDYIPLWHHWQDNGAVIIYKYEHHGDNHVHFHGTLHTSISYSKLLLEGFSIKFDQHPELSLEQWHHYCQHEARETKVKLENDLKEQKIIYKFNEHVRRERYEPSQRKQTNVLFKLQILGNI